MTASKRKAIGKKDRFEVFKRDRFTCQYCGAHPPDVVLQVDHIVAVAAGGANEMDNYITACQPCNIGKGARSLEIAPQSLADKAADVAEREAQLLGWHEVMAERRSRVEDDMWEVAEIIDPGSSAAGMKRDWLGSIRRFNEKLSKPVVIDAAEIARDKYPYGGKRTFLYFCGICWTLIRKDEGNA